MGGVIHPSQSPWCNVVVLVRKKDGGLRFCIDFRRLNSWTKKDAYPLPWMQETMESTGRHPVLFHYGSEIGLLAGQDGQRLPAIHRLYGGEYGSV